MVNEQGLKKGLFLLGTMVLILIGLYASLMIGGLTVGSISNVATSGNVEVSNAMNTSLATLEGGYIADTEAITDNTGLIIALVAIVVLIVVFGFKFNFGGMGNKKAKGVE